MKKQAQAHAKYSDALCDLVENVSKRLSEEDRCQAEIDNSKIDHSHNERLSEAIKNLLLIFDDEDGFTSPNSHETRLHD